PEWAGTTGPVRVADRAGRPPGQPTHNSACGEGWQLCALNSAVLRFDARARKLPLARRCGRTHLEGKLPKRQPCYFQTGIRLTCNSPRKNVAKSSTLSWRTYSVSFDVLRVSGTTRAIPREAMSSIALAAMDSSTVARNRSLPPISR